MTVVSSMLFDSSVHRYAFVMVGLIATLSPVRASAADTRQTCLDAAVKGQQLRKAGKLVEARSTLTTCASEECPRVVRHDCAAWLAEAEGVQPTIVVTVHDARGRDVTDARVSIDGRLVPDALTGRAFPVDPGPHEVRVERPGQPPLETAVTVREGEKARGFSFRMAGGQEGEPGTPLPLPAAPRSPEAAPVGPLTYVLAGVGVIGLGTFAGFGLKGLSDRSDLCTNGTCARSSFERVRTDYIVADVGLGVGVVALAIAAWTFFARGNATATTATTPWSAWPDAALARGRFPESNR